MIVSLDDVQTQKAFAEKHELTYPVLSDPDGSAAEKFGALGSGGRFAKRVTFVVDPEGVVRMVVPKVDVSAHGAQLAAILKELQGS